MPAQALGGGRDSSAALGGGRGSRRSPRRREGSRLERMAAEQRPSTVEPPPVEVVTAKEQVDSATQLASVWAMQHASGGVGGQGRQWFTAVAQALAVVTCSALWFVPTVARATTVCAGDGERRKKQRGVISKRFEARRGFLQNCK